MPPTSTGPLHGVRVLDLSSVIMGPLATQILGDLGADVITVEDPKGTLSRVMTAGPVPQLSGLALNLLRNKRSVVLDLKDPEGRQRLLDIAATVDVMVTNLRPATLGRLRLAYDDVREVRPDIVFCQAQGYPSDSPAADAPAYDDVIQAGSGIPDAFRRQGGVPVLVPTLVADKVSGLTIAYAVLAALFERERTGRGQQIEVPMIDVMTAFTL
ncbi:MAG TPA: CoA transferase, partial [Acidimicrobiales bacterium]